MRGAKKKIRPSQNEIDSACDFACTWLGISKDYVFAKTRSNTDASLTRHIAQYLLSTAHNYCIASIAEIFKRNQRTIAYAVAKIEDMRDDQKFDEFLSEYSGALKT